MAAKVPGLCHAKSARQEHSAPKRFAIDGWGVLALTGLVSALAGCRELSRFTTNQANEAYCGAIVDATMVRRGFGPGVRLRLTFNAARLAENPGTLSTSDGMLIGAEMRPIPELANDPLWTLEFGEGRDKNLLYIVDPTDPADGPSINAVVSLMYNGETEVRLFRSAPSPRGGAPPDPNGKALFGVFAPLRRQTNFCGF